MALPAKYVALALAAVVILVWLWLPQTNAYCRPVDYFAEQQCFFISDDITSPEQDAHGRYCWALGPTAATKCFWGKSGKVRLHIGLRSPFAGQIIALFVNGVAVYCLTNAEAQDGPDQTTLALDVDFKQGVNIIEFQSNFYNNHPTRVLADDRSLSFTLTQLRLEPL